MANAIRSRKVGRTRRNTRRQRGAGWFDRFFGSRKVSPEVQGGTPTEDLPWWKRIFRKKQVAPQPVAVADEQGLEIEQVESNYPTNVANTLPRNPANQAVINAKRNANRNKARNNEAEEMARLRMPAINIAKAVEYRGNENGNGNLNSSQPQQVILLPKPARRPLSAFNQAVALSTSAGGGGRKGGFRRRKTLRKTRNRRNTGANNRTRISRR